MVEQQQIHCSFFRTVSQIGSLPIYLVFIILFFLFDSSWLYLQLLFMVIITTAAVLVLKLLITTRKPKHRRTTAYKQKQNSARRQKTLIGSIRSVMLLARQRSFPSAHASRAAGVLIIVVLYLQNAYLIVLASVYCLIVSYSRLVLKEHRLKDVLAGILIGLLAGYASFVLTEYAVTYFFSSQEPLVYEVVLLS